jgi:ribose transport system substrate-binding protein
MRVAARAFLLVSPFLHLAGCDSGPKGPATTDSAGKVELAFVVNNPSDFWSLARAGIRKAERELDVSVDFQTPGTGQAAQQQQIIETLISKGVKGMAVSVLDPKGAVTIINKASEHMPVITQDSDCPDSKRIAYIGTDNVEAGRVAGGEIKKALPGGGKIAIFVGKLDVANARERHQGIVEALKGSNIEIVDPVFTDEGQRPTAQNNVRNALDKHADLKGLVGLWSYNTPAILQVVTEKGLQGKIAVIGFDEETPTLDGIESGVVQATVVQQPFEFGYQSIRALAKLARKEDPGLPGKLVYVPVKVIDRSTVKEFKARLAEMLAQGR